MTNVIEFPSSIKQKHKCGDPHCATYTITEYDFMEILEGMKLALEHAEELEAISRMTLWQRIFCWKY